MVIYYTILINTTVYSIDTIYYRLILYTIVYTIGAAYLLQQTVLL